MSEKYINRRKNFTEAISDDSFAVIGSGTAPMRSLDEAYQFSVDRNFYYLTGIDSQNMILLMSKIGGRDNAVLFIERFDETLAKWVGGRMLPDEAKNISGVKCVKYIDEFDNTICDLFSRNRHTQLKAYADLWRNDANQGMSFGHLFSNELREKYPQADIEDVYKIMSELRIIKDEDEVADLKKAIKYTGKAVEAMMTYVKPGMNECELEGKFDFELAKAGIREHAFKTIVAGGKRATTLHYSDNCEELKDGELVLTDLGCTYNHYSADITRTYPVNGRFSPRQKEIYDIVLKAQGVVFENAKPGVSVKELNDMVMAFYETALKDAGLLYDGKKVSDYYYHNISHQLGLDTHDVSLGNTKPLKPGMVITVEPGLYIEEESIGIRIEDDILITEDKPIVLSDGIPKTTEEIETLMK